MKSVFNLKYQHDDVDSKMVVALERLSQVFHNLLWNKTKEYNLSPIQIKFLIYILTNNSKDRTVSDLGRRFNLTKATVSDAVGSLVEKKLVQKKESKEDKRFLLLSLTARGKNVAKDLIGWADPIRNSLKNYSTGEKRNVFMFLLKLIESLEKEGMISLNRMCITCRFFEQATSATSNHYCTFLEKPLSSTDLRIDCLDHKVA